MSLSSGLFLLAALGTAVSCSVVTPPRSAEEPVPVFEGDFTRVDESASDPDFQAFAGALGAAVSARDTSALLSLVAPTARFSFDDAPLGPEGARRVWLDDRSDAFWDAIERVVAGGWVGEEDAMTAPYVFALWPSALDPFAHVAVPGPRASAHSRPRGEIVARLSSIAVPVLGPPEQGWWPVTLPDGSAAYVHAADAVSPTGPRVTCWPDADGAWRIQSMLTGD